MSNKQDKLAAVGAKLLDAVYAMREFDGILDEMEKAEAGGAAGASAFLHNGGLEKAVRAMVLAKDRDRLVTEYNTLREALESATE
mgnify:CR=1 FL=1